jgi:hypothetical protein
LGSAVLPCVKVTEVAIPSSSGSWSQVLVRH